MLVISIMSSTLLFAQDIVREGANRSHDYASHEVEYMSMHDGLLCTDVACYVSRDNW